MRVRLVDRRQVRSQPPGIDPRIRARRIAVRRSTGRRRLRIVAVAASVVAVGLVALVVTRTPLLDVDRVEVVGAGARPSAEDVVAAAGLDPGGQPLLDVDLDAVERRVDALPWVAAADGRPGTGRARSWSRIEERQPVAVAPADGGGWVVLAGDGRVLESWPRPRPGWCGSST